MKSKIGIIIFVVIIVLIIIIALLMKNNGSTPINSGEYQPISEETKNIPINWDDGYTPEIPDGYAKMKEDSIENESELVAESIAYYYNSGDDITYVKIYVQNRGEKAINKDSVCNIELADEDGRIYTIGGVFEDSDDLEVGERTVISTQFIEKISELITAKVSINIPEEDTYFEGDITIETGTFDESGNI
ncbi:MAG: hypothetical protein IKR04_01390 [Clostridia bacterium]|nr:hypothetical protein [Clostridia bacterium]